VIEWYFKCDSPVLPLYFRGLNVEPVTNQHSISNMLIRATKTRAAKDGSPRMTHRMVDNSLHGRSVKQIDLAAYNDTFCLFG